MHPVLLGSGTVSIDTYTVVWPSPWPCAGLDSKPRRRLYGLADEDARVSLFWGFLGIFSVRAWGTSWWMAGLGGAPEKFPAPGKGGFRPSGYPGGGLAALAVSQGEESSRMAPGGSRRPAGGGPCRSGQVGLFCPGCFRKGDRGFMGGSFPFRPGWGLQASDPALRVLFGPFPPVPAGRDRARFHAGRKASAVCGSLASFPCRLRAYPHGHGPIEGGRCF